MNIKNLSFHCLFLTTFTNSVKYTPYPTKKNLPLPFRNVCKTNKDWSVNEQVIVSFCKHIRLHTVLCCQISTLIHFLDKTKLIKTTTTTTIAIDGTTTQISISIIIIVTSSSSNIRIAMKPITIYKLYHLVLEL